jgi:hypothetical protein
MQTYPLIEGPNVVSGAPDIIGEWKTHYSKIS